MLITKRAAIYNGFIQHLGVTRTFLTRCCLRTIEHNEDLLPLCVAHFRRLAEQDLVFVADEDAVQDELADGDVSQIPEAAVLTCSGEQLDPSLSNWLPLWRWRHGWGLRGAQHWCQCLMSTRHVFYLPWCKMIKFSGDIQWQSALITSSDGFGPRLSGPETGAGLSTFVPGMVQLWPPPRSP